MHSMNTPSPSPSINKSCISGILYGDCFLAAFITYVSNVKRKTSREPRNIESEEQNKIKKKQTMETRDKTVQGREQNSLLAEGRRGRCPDTRTFTLINKIMNVL